MVDHGRSVSSRGLNTSSCAGSSGHFARKLADGLYMRVILDLIHLEHLVDGLNAAEILVVEKASDPFEEEC